MNYCYLLNKGYIILEEEREDGQIHAFAFKQRKDNKWDVSKLIPFAPAKVVSYPGETS